MSKRPAVSLLMVALFVFLTYAAYLPSGFLMDDFVHLERVQRHSGLAALDFSIRSDDLGIYLWPVDRPVDISYFRPLVMLTLKTDAVVYALNPAGFHAVNVLWHLLNVVLCYLVALRLGLRPEAARLSALVWGVSLHAGPAAGWISGRTEVLSAWFILVSALSFLEAMERNHKRWFPVGVAAMIPALAARESAVLIPFLVLILCKTPRGRGRPADGNGAARASTMNRDGSVRPLYAAVLFAPVLLYFAIRLMLVGHPHLPQPYFQPFRSIEDARMLWSKPLVYLSGALLGIPVVPFVSRGAVESSLPLAAGLTAAVGMLVAVLWRSVRRRRTVFLLAWFLATLLPYFFLMETSLYLYLPLMGICWLIGMGYQERPVFFRMWGCWLVVTGVAANVLMGVFLCRLERTAGDAAASLAEIASDRRSCDVVLVDAPIWAYSLPSAVRLRDADARLRTYIVNFSPSAGPGPASRIEWLSPREMKVTRGAETAVAPPLESSCRGFFDSWIERFFLFGSNPWAAHQTQTSRLFHVDCEFAEQGAAFPTALRVRFAPSGSMDGVTVAQFDHWRLRRVAVPNDSTRSVFEGER
jgi:hypothetical protein